GTCASWLGVPRIAHDNGGAVTRQTVAARLAVFAAVPVFAGVALADVRLTNDPRNIGVLIGSSNDCCGVYNDGNDANGAPIPWGPSGSVITAPKMAAAAFEARSFLDLVYAWARGLGTFTLGDPCTATLKGIE